jgi:glutathione peroxidase
MFKTFSAVALAVALGAGLDAAPKAKPQPKEAPVGVHQFTVTTITGAAKSLADYQGKALLIVNVASECGYTKQYKDLEALHQRFKDKGLAVLGFPSNDFGGQEPGTEAEIKQFCERNFGVSFDLFGKVNAKSEPQAPLYQYLTTQPGLEGAVSWNFNKFLVGKDGRLIARFGSSTKPLDKALLAAIEAAL